LIVPALLALIALARARQHFPSPSQLEQQPSATKPGFTAAYWLNLVAGACFAAGLMNFELIGFHLSESGVSQESVPLFLALGTGVGALTSFGLGRLYDRIGLPVIIGAVIVTAAFSPFVFLLPVAYALIGMVLWGVRQMTQDMLLSALVAGILPEGRRNLAFGLFYAGYGLGWLIGATVAGLLYEQSLGALVIFAAGIQLLSLPLFVLAQRRS
jgi:predicted MFS family arabinose efflux permease